MDEAISSKPFISFAILNKIGVKKVMTNITIVPSVKKRGVVSLILGNFLNFFPLFKESCYLCKKRCYDYKRNYQVTHSP